MNILSNPVVRFILRKRQAYRAVFKPGVATDIVLADLRKFCRASSTPAVASPVSRTIDPIATGIAIGRLEVWHRIAQNLNLSDADLYKYVEMQENGTERDSL